MSFKFWLPTLFALSAFLVVANAAHNVTVDDGDSSILYSAGWEISAATNSLNFGGFHRLTSNKAASATFTFSGVAVYFMSPKWPYDVGVTVSLDGGRAEGIDLQDYGGVNVNDEETVASAVVWGVSGLTNGQHRLIVTPASTKTWAVLDALVYTVPDNLDTTTATNSKAGTTTRSRETTESQSPTAAPSSGSTSSKILAPALGAAGGVLVLGALIFLLLCLRRRRRAQAHTFTTNNISKPTFQTTSTPFSSYQQTFAPTSNYSIASAPPAPPMPVPNHHHQPWDYTRPVQAVGVAGLGTAAMNRPSYGPSDSSGTTTRPYSDFSDKSKNSLPSSSGGNDQVRMSYTTGPGDRKQVETVLEYKPDHGGSYKPPAGMAPSLPFGSAAQFQDASMAAKIPTEQPPVYRR